MKILHTSDWHIGKRLFTKDLEEDHHLFFDWLIDLIIKQNIEVLIVAGDIFDVAYPSNNSLKLYYQTLTRLKDTSCHHVIITGGNHDSVSTLNAPKDILKFLNIHIVGGSPENKEDLIFQITGKSGQTECIICAVPFLRDRDIRESIPGESYEDKTKAIRDGIQNYYNSVVELIKPFKSKGLPIIATGHLFVTGSISTESERDIYIGNLGNFNSDCFPKEFDYFALGHIHRPQVIDNKKHIRYSGSPLAFSFSEKDHLKKVILLNLIQESINQIDEIDVPVFRKLLTFKGTYNQVVEDVFQYKNQTILKEYAEIQMIELKFNPEILQNFEKFINQISHIEILNPRIQFEVQQDDTELISFNESIMEFKASELFDYYLERQNVDDKDELKMTFNELLELTGN